MAHVLWTWGRRFRFSRIVKRSTPLGEKSLPYLETRRATRPMWCSVHARPRREGSPCTRLGEQGLRELILCAAWRLSHHGLDSIVGVVEHQVLDLGKERDLLGIPYRYVPRERSPGRVLD